MSFLWALLSICFTGIQCDKPLDYWMIPIVAVQERTEENIETTFLEWKATWYDYKLNGKWYSKYNDTCALRIKERGWYYKVCIKGTDRCVVCRHNDYWPKEETWKIIDLSSHAFKQLAPLSRWVIEVEIYKVTDK